MPESLRVTARVRKMKLTWVLDDLVEQAGLTHGLQELRAMLGGPPAAALPTPQSPARYVIYIVPKPELRVSGSK